MTALGSSPRVIWSREGTVDELRSTEHQKYAIAVSASAATLRQHLAPLRVALEPDPLEGTAEAPHREGVTRMIFDEPAGVSDQEILRAAMNVGAVHEFTPRRPHLSELFNTVVVAPQDTPEEKPAKKGWFSFGKKGAK